MEEFLIHALSPRTAGKSDDVTEHAPLGHRPPPRAHVAPSSGGACGRMRSCATGNTTTRTAVETARQPSLPGKDRRSHSHGRLGAVLVQERELCRLVGMVVSLHAHRGVRLVGAQRGPEHLDRTRLQDPAQRQVLSACSIQRQPAHTAANPAHAAPAASPRTAAEWQPVRGVKAAEWAPPPLPENARTPRTLRHLQPAAPPRGQLGLVGQRKGVRRDSVRRGGRHGDASVTSCFFKVPEVAPESRPRRGTCHIPDEGRVTSSTRDVSHPRRGTCHVPDEGRDSRTK